ncbi:EXPERA domain-containing protein [Frankia sp. AiPs1]|uniref:hypothetical protein n=1 Tax=Frankia sp. AiPa1 TaxID=573492 RepID=UPI00202B405B|nr:hypothetical protein [Frankia sp. AiPa1]MCL9762759.1 hypothetical protein [Frankia sp. AiPa1]
MTSTGLVAGQTSTTYDDHTEESREAQRQADRWLISGTILMGTAILGILGLPLFLRGLALQRRAQARGLSVRPIIVTLIGYMVMLDGALNTFGWSIDLLANHTLVSRIFLPTWGNMFDGGYFWHYNELSIGGASAPGEKAWEVLGIFVVFPMRIAACIGLLQMKRWGHQWTILTCWTGVLMWVGYVANMTVYADIRFTAVVFPVIGWWLYDIFYITPFVSLPYLHTVNREIFTD